MRHALLLMALLLAACGPTCEGTWVVTGEETYAHNTGLCLVWQRVGDTRICTLHHYETRTRPTYACREGRA